MAKDNIALLAGSWSKSIEQGRNQVNDQKSQPSEPLMVEKSQPPALLNGKRGKKRRRFTSPFPSDREAESDQDSDLSDYIPSNPHNRSFKSHRARLSESLINDSSEVGAPSGLSQTTVIYEQQTWEGEIIDERDVKLVRGRPRKQYLVRWKSTWVDAGRLKSPELVQVWKDKKESRHGQ